MTRKNFLIIALPVLVVLVGGVLWWRSLPPDLSAPVVDFRDPQLTQEQKQGFVDRIEKAKQELEKFSTDDKSAEKFQTLLTLAAEYYPIGELKLSLDNYLAASKLFPSEPLPYYAMATVEQARNNFQEAEKQIQKAIELKPETTEYWRFYLDMADRNLDFSKEKMQSYIDDAMKNTKSHPDISSWAARYLEGQGDLQAAVKFWNLAKEKNPDSAAIYDEEINRLLELIRNAK